MRPIGKLGEKTSLFLDARLLRSTSLAEETHLLGTSPSFRSLIRPSQSFLLWCFRKWMESPSPWLLPPPPSFAYHHIILWIGSSVCLLLLLLLSSSLPLYDEEHDWQWAGERPNAETVSSDSGLGFNGVQMI